MHRRLAKAVIATFRGNCWTDHRDSFDRLQLRDWRRGLSWIDASGLALYFCDRLRDQGLAEQVPAEILSALDARRANNVARTAELFKEFSVVNRELCAARLLYANFKGFTLVPDYCHDPALRCQFDLDFIGYSSDLPVFQTVFGRLGYSLTGGNRNVAEFKADAAQPPSISELYKPRRQRSLELHLVTTALTCQNKASPLEHLQYRSWRGVTFPMLSDCDLFLAQAHHLFRHFRSEWTRLSWLLEFRTFVVVRRDDSRFWTEVSRAASGDDILAVGVALLLATRIFGDFAPSALAAWSMAVIPKRVRLWLECYGEDMLLADFPGSKLYLLLERELAGNRRGQATNWPKLLPLHRPQRITYSKGVNGLQALRASVSEICFAIYRARFHAVEGMRYMRVARHWKKAAGSVGDAGPYRLSYKAGRQALR